MMVWGIFVHAMMYGVEAVLFTLNISIVNLAVREVLRSIAKRR